MNNIANSTIPKVRTIKPLHLLMLLLFTLFVIEATVFVTLQIFKNQDSSTSKPIADENIKPTPTVATKPSVTPTVSEINAACPGSLETTLNGVTFQSLCDRAPSIVVFAETAVINDLNLRAPDGTIYDFGYKYCNDNTSKCNILVLNENLLNSQSFYKNGNIISGKVHNFAYSDNYVYLMLDENVHFYKKVEFVIESIGPLEDENGSELGYYFIERLNSDINTYFIPINDVVNFEELLNKINTLESGDYCYLEVKNLLESIEVVGDIYFRLDTDFNIELL